MTAKKKKKLYHIYPASSSNNILYISTIVNALENDFEQVAFVSAASPLQHKLFKKWLHPLTDFFRAKGTITKFIRYPIRYIEFISVFKRIYFYCLTNKPDYLNLSASTLLPFEFNFIQSLKRKNIKVIYTVHDAQQFAVGYTRMSDDKRKSFYNLFDYIIVHNEVSKIYLEQNFSVTSSVFISIPFPPMDLAEINIKRSNKANAERTFLFIGAFKKEKGYDILVQAWREIFSNKKNFCNARLILAGQVPQGVEFLIDESIALPENVTIIKKFLPDKEYIDFINTADIVVLPYIVGTNSAVLSTAASMGKIIIASDIPSLKTQPLILQENIFVSNNVSALRNKIIEFLNFSDADLAQKKKLQQVAFEEYEQIFNMQAQAAFKKLA